MMRVAIPHWQGRVSPVFDVAGNVLLVDVADGRETARRNVATDAPQPEARARLLADQSATTLICGAISRPLELALAAASIEVISHTCGDIEQVLAAFIDGRLNQDTFLMPGCCGRRNRGRANPGRGQGGGRNCGDRPRGHGPGSGRCRRQGRKQQDGENNA